MCIKKLEWASASRIGVGVISRIDGNMEGSGAVVRVGRDREGRMNGLAVKAGMRGAYICRILHTGLCDECMSV